MIIPGYDSLMKLCKNHIGGARRDISLIIFGLFCQKAIVPVAIPPKARRLTGPCQVKTVAIKKIIMNNAGNL